MPYSIAQEVKEQINYQDFRFDRTSFNSYIEAPLFAVARLDLNLKKQDDYVLEADKFAEVHFVMASQGQFDQEKSLAHYGSLPSLEDQQRILAHRNAWQSALDLDYVEDDHFVIFYEPYYYLDVEIILSINFVIRLISSCKNINAIDCTSQYDNYFAEKRSDINLNNKYKFASSLDGYFPTGPLFYFIRKKALRELLKAPAYQFPNDFLLDLPLDQILITNNFSKSFPDLSKIDVSKFTRGANSEINNHLSYLIRKNIIKNSHLIEQILPKSNKKAVIVNKLDVKAFVLTLESTPERYENFLLNWESDHFIRFNGVDARLFSQQEIEDKFDLEQAEKLYTRKIAKGEVGCSLSHLQIFQAIVDDPTIAENDWSLITEDDAVLRKDWVERINIVVNKLKHDDTIQLIVAQHNKVNILSRFPLLQMLTIHKAYYNIGSYENQVMLDKDMSLGSYFSYKAEGASCYLIRKSACRKALSIKPFWVADQFNRFIKLDQMAFLNPVISVLSQIESTIEDERRPLIDIAEIRHGDYYEYHQDIKKTLHYLSVKTIISSLTLNKLISDKIAKNSNDEK